MITTNVFHRVFHIQYGKSTGTCFILDKDEKRYIVTALHVVKNVNPELKLRMKIKVFIYHDNAWKPVELKLVGLDQEVDIAVFTFVDCINDIVNKMNQALYSLEGNIAGLTYGQQVYFLGFPFGMVGDIIYADRRFPLPFVKSGVLTVFNADRFHSFYVDGNSNRGFSGGPVIATPPGADVKNFRVIGVLTSSLYTRSIGFIENRQVVAEFPENTGLIKVSGITCVNKIIEANPFGIEVRNFQEDKQL